MKIYTKETVFAASVEVGTTLQTLCDEHEIPILFACRKGDCGVCMVRVLEGGENLSLQGAREQMVLGILTPAPDRRLACQCTVFGDVTIEVAD